MFVALFIGFMIVMVLIFDTRVFFSYSRFMMIRLVTKRRIFLRFHGFLVTIII